MGAGADGLFAYGHSVPLMAAMMTAILYIGYRVPHLNDAPCYDYSI
jgi:hypothetical protein